MAGSGEVTIKFTVEKGGYVTQAEFELFDDDAKKIGGKTIICCVGGSTEQAVVRVNVTRRQPLLLRVILNRTLGSGKLHLQISGAVEFYQNAPSSKDNPENSGASACFDVRKVINQGSGSAGFNIYMQGSQASQALIPKHFPKEGTLIIQMKDGSTKTIDLSQAELIIIFPPRQP